MEKETKKNTSKEKSKRNKEEEEWGEEGKEKDSSESLADMGDDVIEESVSNLGIEDKIEFGADSVEAMIDNIDILHPEDMVLESGQSSQAFSTNQGESLESVAEGMMSGGASTNQDPSSNPNKYQNTVKLYNEERNDEERRAEMTSGRAVHLNLLSPTELVSEGIGQRVFGVTETSGDFRRENFRMMRHNAGRGGGEDMGEGKLYEVGEKIDDGPRNPFTERGGDERVRATKRNYEGRRI